MRFIADGPSVPNDLITARDDGDVILFCGAGVSQANAGLPDFETLGKNVIEILGSAQNGPARRLLEKARELGRMAGVGGLVATDRIFSLLEREFEVRDVRTAIAQAIKPNQDHDLLAHRILLDIATAPNGITRLVTTNFDLLFEECAPVLLSSGPPHLPDPKNDRDFRGVIHLHGRVNEQYDYVQDDEFVASSADFGRAYLSDGWATRFIQALLTRYQIVFIGYSADDPPIQYLLEALNLHAGHRSRLYAFQEGDSGAAAALWEHKGVQAISFDSSDKYRALWATLSAWGERARDIDGWYANLFSKVIKGPAELGAHLRGQIANIISTPDGAHRIANADEPLDAMWLLVFDSHQRYGKPERVEPYDKFCENFDPFTMLCLDFDVQPDPGNHDNILGKRNIPADTWDGFSININDLGEQGEKSLGIRDRDLKSNSTLSKRLISISIWLQRIAHQPVALWWASHQNGLHPIIVKSIQYSLRREAHRFSANMLRGWRQLLASWSDVRESAEMFIYEIEERSIQEGWTPALIRMLAAVYRPQIIVKPAFGKHPLLWGKDVPDGLIRIDIDYPQAHKSLIVPDELLDYTIAQFRENLILSKSLEQEISGNDSLYFSTTCVGDDGPDLLDDSYGLTGPIIIYQKLMGRLVKLDPLLARAETKRWPIKDDYIFARLRIWAAGIPNFLDPTEVALIFRDFSETVFWGSFHERDLLYALRDRWAEFSADDKEFIEHRLLIGAFPWSGDNLKGREENIALDRLNRLYWLFQHGVIFSFDVAKKIEELHKIVPEWTTHAGDQVGNSNALTVQSINVDNNPDLILSTPISQVLTLAHEARKEFTYDRVRKEPFKGLVMQRPYRALAVLTYAARYGEAPLWAWSDFLYADTRPTDRLRMINVIAERLNKLSPEALQGIINPVTEWMEHLAPRLYTDAAPIFGGLWNKILEAIMNYKTEKPHDPNKGWADDAINAPVGKLANLLMKDPIKNDLAHAEGFPSYWTGRFEQLLALPGDMRQYAIVMVCYQLCWLFVIDPVWTERHLISLAERKDVDGDAFWEGLLWSARIPNCELFLLLKSFILARAVQPQVLRHKSNIFAGFILDGWGGLDNADQPKKLVTDIELREVLIQADDTFRGQILRYLENWSTKTPKPWREHILYFLKNVWPKQRALHTPLISAMLTDLAFASGELMPAIVQIILPMLVPIRGSLLRMMYLKDGDDSHPVRCYPIVTLNIFYVILAEDPSLWPYKTDEVLDYLSQCSETKDDPRISEIRRRRNK
ncbi:SIR2 family protein [Sodalis sp. RH20]|uniref:SIR2 family protein n=1 Tax=unclassified Sodalis (in: enterobacteria) TaxID=2636512 RepID=UPI0039B43D51